jgi:hypothetical protein
VKQSTGSHLSDVEAGASTSENASGAANSDLPDKVSSFADPQATSSESPAVDGSVRYRIAALIAMLLLALASMGIWLYSRGN